MESNHLQESSRLGYAEGALRLNQKGDREPAAFVSL